MSVVKEQVQKRDQSVTKKEFEKAYVELMDNIRIMDQRISTKADEVVLTMTLAHRQEIEELQSEVIDLHQTIKKLKQENAKRERQQLVTNFKKDNSIVSWFKNMQFARK